MKSLNIKLLLSAVGIALLATPALAQHRYRQNSSRTLYDYNVQASNFGSGYPNPVARSGSASQAQSGAFFDLDRGY
ncbi:MAG: hypothetical protein ACRECE_05410 [Xanthobacteraceae bacterium]